MSIEVLKQMVEALEWCHGGEPIGTAEAIQAGKKLITELENQEQVSYSGNGTAGRENMTAPTGFLFQMPKAEQEPVAWHEPSAYGNVTTHKDWALANGWQPLYTHPQPKRKPLTEWKPIETAPKDTEVLLYCNKFIPLYIGKKRYGGLGEPQQDEFAWRCSSSGRFANPTYWMPLPKPPIEAAHGIKGEA